MRPNPADAPQMDAVRREALEVAAGWSVPGAPQSWILTAAIFRSIADDPEPLALAATIPPDRLPPLLLSAAVRHLVDRLRPPALARYFPAPGESQPPLDAGFDPAFREFCADHREDLLALCRTHRYQMNEVARCAQLALALGVVAGARPGRPLALVDAGTGAGLALNLDRYRYQVDSVPSFGDPSSALTVHCARRGQLRPCAPDHLPEIVFRAGIDTNPVDLGQPEEGAWLRSCVPPEVESLDRFDRAAAITVSHPVTLVAGDAWQQLPKVVDQVPPDPLLVVLDSYTAVFFSEERLQGFRSAVDGAAATRDLAWISLDPLVPLGAEGRFSVQGLDVPEELVRRYRREGVFGVLGLVEYGGGVRSGRLLGRAHPSGTWLEWLDPATAC
jgi:hypothetical protein